MYSIGQKVIFDGDIIGYIVGISIDPLEEHEVSFEAKNMIIYTIRIFRDYAKYGYFDFQRTKNDITIYE